MKKSSTLVRLLTTVAVIVFMVISERCSKATTSSAKEIAQGQLCSGTWMLANLTVDNVDKTNLYTGLTLSFSAESYLTTNGKLPVWPTTGAWAFTDDSGKNITRDGSLSVTILQLDKQRLVLSMNWPTSTFSGGRTSSISGNNVFTFRHQ